MGPRTLQKAWPPATIKKARWFLELLGGIANRPIALVTPHELLDVLKRVERRGHHETARRLRSFAGRIFRYGFATLRTERNPADILRGALTVPKVKHHAAIIEPKKVGELLRAIYPRCSLSNELPSWVESGRPAFGWSSLFVHIVKQRPYQARLFPVSPQRLPDASRSRGRSG